jgi:hypothetical protein
MKFYSCVKVQMTDVIGEYLPVSKVSFDYEGPIAKLGGGPSDEEKQNAKDEHNTAVTTNNIANREQRAAAGNLQDHQAVRHEPDAERSAFLQFPH